MIFNCRYENVTCIRSYQYWKIFRYSKQNNKKFGININYTKTSTWVIVKWREGIKKGNEEGNAIKEKKVK